MIIRWDSRRTYSLNPVNVSNISQDGTMYALESDRDLDTNQYPVQRTESLSFGSVNGGPLTQFAASADPNTTVSLQGWTIL